MNASPPTSNRIFLTSRQRGSKVFLLKDGATKFNLKEKMSNCEKDVRLKRHLSMRNRKTAKFRQLSFDTPSNFGDHQTEMDKVVQLGEPLDIYIDGPFGSPSSNFYRAEHAVLIGIKDASFNPTTRLDT